jgi:DNA-binding SARP family transcriptional activator
MTASAGIEFLLLGPTEARRDGEPVALSGARRRALVARLLIDANRVVPAETLVADVWEDKTDPPAVATLQSHISQLRKVLGTCLTSDLGGYTISLDLAGADLVEFERQAQAGMAGLSGGDYSSALASLTQALGLWRGRALQDVADRSWAQPEAVRLEELRARSIEQLLQARLYVGQHEQVAVDAEAAVAEQPLREQRWAIMIQAFYQCGRQADALRAYQRLRNLLAEQLGIDPSPPLVALEGAILRQDQNLDPLGRDRSDAAGWAPTQLSQGRTAARQRDWRSAYELLSAADHAAHLGAEDLELLGDVAFMAGQQEISISARQRAHSLWLDAGRAARAAISALLIVGNYYVRNRPVIAAGWYHKGRRLLQDQPEDSAHGVLAFTGALIAMANGQPEVAAASAAEAQRIGRAFADLNIETLGLALHGCALARLGRLDEAQPMLDESLATASTGELGAIATGQIFCWSTQALLAVGDYARAAEWIETIEASGIEGIPGDCRVHRAEVLRALGRPDHAETEAAAARSETQAVDLLHAGIAHYELAMIHLTRGDLQQANRSLDHAAACGAAVQPGLALLRLAEGDVDGAASMIDAALLDPAVDSPRRARLLPAAIQIATVAGLKDRAAERITELRQLANRYKTDGLLHAAYAPNSW